MTQRKAGHVKNETRSHIAEYAQCKIMAFNYRNTHPSSGRLPGGGRLDPATITRLAFLLWDLIFIDWKCSLHWPASTLCIGGPLESKVAPFIAERRSAMHATSVLLYTRCQIKLERVKFEDMIASRGPEASVPQSSECMCRQMRAHAQHMSAQPDAVGECRRAMHLLSVTSHPSA